VKGYGATDVSVCWQVDRVCLQLHCQHTRMLYRLLGTGAKQAGAGARLSGLLLSSVSCST
jgi:hypothetical protein